MNHSVFLRGQQSEFSLEPAPCEQQYVAIAGANAKGFSLVELAIVLVIIGLITGGILTGQELIRASELNSVMADVNKYKTAFNTFKLKYNALPGDLANATAYWGTASGGCPNGAGTGTQTCNGDGNGRINWQASEVFRAWQHLSNAGLISGNYTGVFTDAATYTWGTNGPASKIANAGFATGTNGYYTDVNWFASDYGTMFILAGGGGSIWSLTTLNPTEAASIDGKNDDGRPGSGAIMTLNSNYWSCASTAVASTATYRVDLTTNSCNLFFKAGF